MYLRLKRKSQLPLHVQLKAQLAHLIQAGRWGAGARLPTVRELAASLGINRNTASRVFADLEREGYLSCERGRGTFVAARQAGPKSGKTRELLLLVDEAIGQARRLGIGPSAFAAALYARTHASPKAAGVARVPILLVECSRGGLDRVRSELGTLPLKVRSLLIRNLKRVVARRPGFLGDYALVVTTVLHAREVRRLLAKTRAEVLGLPGGTVRLIPGCGADAGNLRRMPKGTVVVVCSPALARRVRTLAPRDAEILVDDRSLDPAGIQMLRRRLALLRRGTS